MAVGGGGEGIVQIKARTQVIVCGVGIDERIVRAGIGIDAYVLVEGRGGEGDHGVGKNAAVVLVVEERDGEERLEESCAAGGVGESEVIGEGSGIGEGDGLKARPGGRVAGKV